MSKICLLLLIFQLFFMPWPVFAQGDGERLKALQGRVKELEREMARLKRMLDTSYKFSESIVLFDKKIDLTKEEIRERFEREFFLLVERRGLIKILLKRYFKWREFLQREIASTSSHPDLIFVAIAESYLNPRAVSPQKAAGLWQFVKETGREEGLYVDEGLDERYDIVRATRTALAHIKRLEKEFGDSFLALAAYNAGRARVKEAIENQRTRDFFELFLPEETERYVMRIAALKEIISNHEKYGIYVVESELYRSLRVTQRRLVVEREIPVTVISDAMGLSYKAFRDLNLHVRKYKLERGNYYINVPEERVGQFERKISETPFVRLEQP